MTRRQIVAIIGSVLLIVGVFIPIISAPIWGSINFFRNGHGDGTIIFGLGIVSLVLALLDFCGWLFLTGLGSLLLTVIDLVRIIEALSDAKGQLHALLAGNMFQGLADVALDTIQLQWGWAVIVLGSIVVIAGAAIPDAREELPCYEEESEPSSLRPLLLGCGAVVSLGLVVAFVLGQQQSEISNPISTKIKSQIFSNPGLRRLNIQVSENPERDNSERYGSGLFGTP